MSEESDYRERTTPERLKDKEELLNPQAEEIDRLKKLQYGVTELSKAIEVLTSKCATPEEIFSSAIVSRRTKLRDICLTLIKDSPETFGSWARERLWRNVFYKPIAFVRKLQKNQPYTNLQVALIRCHFLGCVGTLSHIGMNMFEQYGQLSSRHLINFIPDIFGMERMKTSTDEEHTLEDKDVPKWLMDIMYMNLINIGDSYRYVHELILKSDYKQDYEDAEYLTKSEHFYIQAFLLNPNLGLSQNQLANLKPDSCWGLEPIYHLMCSVLTEHAYEGALVNLRQMLDQKLVSFARLPASVETENGDILANSLLSLVYHFLFDESHIHSFDKSMEEFFSLFYRFLNLEEYKQDSRALFLISSICVMLVTKLRLNKSDRVPAAVALALSVMCEILSKVTKILHHLFNEPKSSPEEESSEEVIEEIIEVQSIHESSDENDEKFVEHAETNEEKEKTDKGEAFEIKENEETCKNKTNVEENAPDSKEKQRIQKLNGLYYHALRRRRPMPHSEDESDDVVPFGREGDQCHVSPSSDDESSDSSYNSDSEDDSFSDELAADSDENDSITNEMNDKEKEESNESDGDLGLNLVDEEVLGKCQEEINSLFAALLPLIRWIPLSSKVKDAFAAYVEKEFLQSLCSAFNMLLSYDWCTALKQSEIEEDMRTEWKNMMRIEEPEEEMYCFLWELPEDTSMLGIALFKSYTKLLRYKPVLTKEEKLLIRMGRFLSFGFWMMKTDCFSISFDSVDKFHVEDSQNKLKVLTTGIRGRSKFPRNKRPSRARGNKMFKRFSERSREGERDEFGGICKRNRRKPVRSLKNDFYNWDHLFAVVDLEACLHHLKAIKQLADFPSFIVNVPKPVYLELDSMKDINEDARIAFRWIDRAISKSNSGVRCMRDHEHSHIDKVSYPNFKLDAESENFMFMLEHCNYILEECIREHARPMWKDFGDIRDKYRIFFLTGVSSYFEQSVEKNYNPIKIARDSGIFVDYIKHYNAPRRRRRRKRSVSGKG